ncbi:CBS domain-containing protein [Maribacter sp. TH_r10]|uniref:CBS domain-containing protein n=1 Tax=Maribacter luteus TaxID=2594478 RepID=A0A6I2MS26_9FLAO|nr:MULTISPECIES: CBS domain-containing protein [Maribacter]MDV7140737.1 CBS domain-containing protein [Maribacter sp. TH_r10]MRX65677.1 CBS domain-containing protein [Maribacter luteus]
MKKGTPISAIMTKNVITLSTSDNLEKAEHLFRKHHIRHIPVVSGSKIIGMLSYTDLLRISFADAVYEDEDSVDSMVYNMFSIEQVMAKSLFSVSSDTYVKDVAEMLSKKEFHAIPVVDDGELKGIVTTTDMINFLLQQYED